MAVYKKDRHSFKWRITFNKPKLVKLPNGTKVTEPVAEFKRWAAVHKASTNYIETLDGFDRRYDIILAVNAIYKDRINHDFEQDLYTVTFRDTEYVIRILDLDEGVDLRGFHLIYLRRKDYQTDGR